jgi:zinc protease
MVPRLVFTLIALVVLTFSQASGQSAAGRRHAPTVAQIVERFIEATGGRNAWLKTKSQYAAGTIGVSGVDNTGTYEVYSKGNQSLVVMRFNNGVEIRNGFDGQRSWSQTQQAAPQYGSPAKLAATKRDADPYKYLHFAEHFPNAKLKGVTDIDGSKAYIVEAKAVGETNPELLYFDLKTGFLVLRDTSHHNGDGKVIPDMIYYSDYRFVDRVKIAYTLRIIQGDMTITTKHSNVKINLAIDDTIFRLPAPKGNE